MNPLSEQGDAARGPLWPCSCGCSPHLCAEQVGLALDRARDAERAHLQMVRKAGELRDERDRLMAADGLHEYDDGTVDIRPTTEGADA